VLFKHKNYFITSKKLLCFSQVSNLKENWNTSVIFHKTANIKFYKNPFIRLKFLCAYGRTASGSDFPPPPLLAFLFYKTGVYIRAVCLQRYGDWPANATPCRLPCRFTVMGLSRAASPRGSEI
jgi:hypothetical protein